MTEQLEWHGCYDDSWDGFIAPEAFAHPAKFSRGLITRIYKHMLAEGMLARGDSVVDPFGGIGTGGIIAAGLGLNWYGCELEEKFVGLAKANFAKHMLTWMQFDDPAPVIVQGDSRKLRENLLGVMPAAVVCSPPYAEAISGTGQHGIKCDNRDHRKENSNAGANVYGDNPGQLGAMKPGSVDSVVSSPPYTPDVALNPGEKSRPEAKIARLKSEGKFKEAEVVRQHGSGKASNLRQQDYGYSPGQLGQMPAGQVDSVITSPPYAECLQGDNTAKETAAESRAKRITEGGSLGQSCRHQGYGSAENLGNLKGGSVEAVVTSPPYEGSNDHERPLDSTRAKNGRHAIHLPYGETAGNVGNESGETFWAAACAIVLECHAILKPGGYAAFVVKAFVRNKQIVDFPGDWRKLCEACGFVLVQEVHAMLVKEERHADLFGGDDHIKKRERKSFFRRLAEKKGSPRIDYEVVQFFRKDTV